MRALDALATAELDRAGRGETGERTLTGVEPAIDWLRQLEACSGNDDELADEVGGTLALLRAIVGRAEGAT